MPYLVVLLVCPILLVLCWRLSQIGHRSAGLPPGPPTVPILGNILQMPARDLHKQLQAWANQYGPIYSLVLGTQTLIVLSSDQTVKDLLDKRSAIYSDRQDMYVANELGSGGLRFLFLKYGPSWRVFRRLTHQLLNINVARSYVPYQDLENKQLLVEMLDDPSHLLENIRRYSNSLTTSMVFGYRTPSHDDPNLVQLFEGFSQFAVVTQTATAALVSFFPILRHLPDFLSPTQALAKKLHIRERELYLRHWIHAKDAAKKGTSAPCFAIGMAAEQEKEGFSDAQAAYITGSLLEAGSDTTSSSLYGFVQAMMLFPEAQTAAQKEIDRVVGSDKLPTMDDFAALPYMLCCMKESLRWMPTTITGGVPHAVTRDDEYMGYHIPKGAGVLLNAWAIHMDPKRHPEPRTFRPERYKDDGLGFFDSAVNSDASKRDQYVFGAGRRLCQGMHVAERSLFLGMTRLLWAFEIKAPKDADGKPILPNPDNLTQGFVCMPEPYEADIIPRSAGKVALIRQAWKDAQANLDEKDQWKHIPESMSFAAGKGFAAI
ncbi:putative cytochrome P450 [Saccharata proteae CBS 121410]|uniref:Cytochrome P450 n=1 Tax=Saccharata proteae CBS 121410 TaxID=1314787 RepID=A0A9P4HRR8_9PEZI|nr:putative cytochrome P450 [Saccharata proteae CBS 121410]